MIQAVSHHNNFLSVIGFGFGFGFGSITGFVGGLLLLSWLLGKNKGADKDEKVSSFPVDSLIILA